MSSILLKNVILDGQCTNVLIEGNKFKNLNAAPDAAADETVDGGGHLALLPAFYNLHTHAAMTLFRGYAGDKELFDWLNNYIWPAEARLTEDQVYWGTRLAICEMIRSGTVFMNDMYWHQFGTIRAVEESGIRSSIGAMFLCNGDGSMQRANEEMNERLFAARSRLVERLTLTLAPHAIYTVSGPVLRQVAELAARENYVIHIHAAETRREVDDCKASHGGLTPVAYLDSLGILTPRTILAHCAVLEDADIDLIAQRRSVIAHNPASNLKLVSGQFRFKDASERGCRITIGTDGTSSNNALSMFSEMKFAALLAKKGSGDPTAAKAEEVFRCATVNGAEAFGFNAGEIAPDKLADCQLIELDHPVMINDSDLWANLVYAADPSVVDTVICNGKILMQAHQIPGENEVLREARRCCHELLRS